MPDPETTPPRGRLQAALYEGSLKRLRKKGLDEEAARRVADTVARRATDRTKTPEFDSPDELADAVHGVCKSLGEGKSYYDVIGERPYLVTGRIDQLVAAAGRVRPEVPHDTALAAKRATALERLSGGLAVLFTAIALAAIGIWYALGVGVFVSIGSELYVQMGMPARARQVAARFHLARWFSILALVVLLLAGFSWLNGSDYSVVKGLGLAVFALVVATVLPGLTLAVLVGLRERRWRSALERELADKEREDS